jgi:esterase/lipase superfamily enzyme
MMPCQLICDTQRQVVLAIAGLYVMLQALLARSALAPHRLPIVLVALVGLALFDSRHAWTQGSPDRWVILATRAIDTRAGRARIDLHKAKGAFRAVRLAVKGGALTLTRVEVTYSDGTVLKVRRSLTLREQEKTPPLARRADDAFIDSITLSFRGAAGELEKATIEIAGLQSPEGAVAVRTPPPSQQPPATPGPGKATSQSPKGGEETDRQASEGKAPKARKAVPQPEPRRPETEAPKPAPVVRGLGEPWDVVPVFYGTDRGREQQGAGIGYGVARARRLELGRALVTVPKAHQLPNIERPWVYRLPFTQIVLHSEAEDPRLHFTLKDVRPLTEAEFIKLVQERLETSNAYKDHALVFVHGFNTSFEYALYRTAQIAYDIKFDGAPLLYSWPSMGTLKLQDYSHDRESSGQAEPYLREFLELIARDTGAKSVSIIAHSMGNQLLLPALRDLKRRAPADIRISQVILAAPDVDRDAFENIAQQLAGISRGVTMLAAGNDLALDISRRFWGGVPRAGDVPPGGPIVTDGIDTIDITAVSTKVFALNHSGYADTNALLSDIQLLIQTGERPPDKRVPILERIKTAKGDYWRYPR